MNSFVPPRAAPIRAHKRPFAHLKRTVTRPLRRQAGRLLVNPSLMAPTLAAMTPADLVELSVLADRQLAAKYREEILAVLRAETAQAVLDGETDSRSPVVRVRIPASTWEENPPQWSATELTLHHADGTVTRWFDASHTTLETLLPDLTCVEQPATCDSLTIDLSTGHFSR
ncbi:hypothetical protein [Streptomyces sp. NPDC001889]